MALCLQPAGSTVRVWFASSLSAYGLGSDSPCLPQGMVFLALPRSPEPHVLLI